MRFEKMIRRNNGDLVKIVNELHESLFSKGIEQSNYVLVMHSGEENWRLYCHGYTDRTASMSMSVDDYINKGRPPILSQVTIGELLKASSEAHAQFSRFVECGKGDYNGRC